jgi:curved DNA-binding protein CbpA
MASSYYEVLGVSPTADQSTIRKAYLKLSLKHHPDKNPGAEEEAKANFISIGEAYEVLGDPVRRAQYDRELQGGTFTFKRPQRQTNSDYDDVQAEKDFNNFMNMFDETVAGMSEAELNVAMGAAAVVGGIVGSILASKAAKRNSVLSSAVQMLGSSVASRAASSLVQSVHTDSQQRVLERREREAAIARGESVPEPTTTETRERLFKDAKNTAQKVAEAAFGGASSSSTSSNATTCANNGRGSGMSWGQAAKLAAMAAGAMAEMQSTQRR